MARDQSSAELDALESRRRAALSDVQSRWEQYEQARLTALSLDEEMRRLRLKVVQAGPSLEAGKGDRRDCVRYEGEDGCLARWTFAQGGIAARNEKPARCPKHCAWFEAPDQDARLLAIAGRRLDG